MLDILKLRKAEEEFKKAESTYLEELKEWKIRAKEICKIYGDKVGDEDEVKLTFSHVAVSIHVIDFADDVIATHVVFIKDFIADDFEERIIKKREEEQRKKKEYQKKIEENFIKRT